MRYAEGGATQATEAAADAGQKFVINAFSIGIDAFRMVDERLKSKIIVNVGFLLLQPHFTRVQDIIGIEGVFDGPHHVQGRSQLFFNVRRPGKTRPVFSGDGTPHFKGQIGQFVGGGPHPIPFIFAPHVGDHGGMDISVADMAEGGH